jgi:glycosyltransferase involved in cell wall biosynthesis
VSGTADPYGDTLEALSSSSRLRIGIDGRAFKSPAAGIRRYIHGLTRALLTLGEPIEIIALGGTDPGALPPGTGFVPEPAHLPTNFGWTQVGVPLAAHRARVDLIHAQAYTAPFWPGRPLVLTIHDVSYELHPEWYPYKRDWLRRAFYRGSAHAATHILTVSRFSASEIHRAYGIPPERITVAPLAADRTFAPRDPAVPEQLPAGVRAPYVLTVGDLHDRRNLAMLVEAVITARRHSGAVPALSLVMVGKDLGVADGLCAMASNAGARDAIVHLTAVSGKQLRALYRGAVALVYPSLYEGFGLPVVEAMASGTPVITSNTTALPELVDGAGVTLAPGDIDAWTRAVIDVANSDERRARMRTDGIRRASEFTWDRTARLTLETYRRVLRQAS